VLEQPRLGQGKQRGLEGIVGVVFIAQHISADVQHHRAVAPEGHQA
jgi:hypothetical protein